MKSTFEYKQIFGIEKSKLRHYVLYILVGAGTTIINLSVFKGLLLLGVHYLICSVAAFVLSVLFAFIFSRKYVFSPTDNLLKEIISFYAARGFTLLVNLVGIVFLVSVVNIEEFLAQVIINGIIIILNYVLSKYLVFKS